MYFRRLHIPAIIVRQPSEDVDYQTDSPSRGRRHPQQEYVGTKLDVFVPIQYYKKESVFVSVIHVSCSRPKKMEPQHCAVSTKPLATENPTKPTVADNSNIVGSFRSHVREV